jgi:hypothetical protein
MMYRALITDGPKAAAHHVTIACGHVLIPALL